MSNLKTKCQLLVKLSALTHQIILLHNVFSLSHNAINSVHQYLPENLKLAHDTAHLHTSD
jgi:hypothetical protein